MDAGVRVVIFGAGGHGKVVAEIALLQGYDVVAFIDDAKAHLGVRHLGRPVVALDRLLAESSDRPRHVALGIGNNDARRRSAARLSAIGFELATLVHPRAHLSASARLSPGVVVVAGATVNADAVLEEGAIVNTNAVVEHDCFVGQFAHVGPGSVMCGGSRLGPGAALGPRAVVPVLGAVEADAMVPPGAIVAVP
jgi:sugar O-acyltransferase (sialic acid O-acetyltransferase NeuD family)